MFFAASTEHAKEDLLPVGHPSLQIFEFHDQESLGGTLHLMHKMCHFSMNGSIQWHAPHVLDVRSPMEFAILIRFVDVSFSSEKKNTA